MVVWSVVRLLASEAVPPVGVEASSLPALAVEWSSEEDSGEADEK